MAYQIWKLVHVLLAIVAVGFSFTFGIIMASAKPDTLLASLGIVTRLEKISRPAFFGLIITGLIMGWIAGYGAQPYWFSGSLLIALCSLTLAMTVAVPTLRKLTALASKPPPPADEMRRLGGRSRVTGMVLGLLSLTLIALMVLKPG